LRLFISISVLETKINLSVSIKSSTKEVLEFGHLAMYEMKVIYLGPRF